jgi:oxygen-independent coproporphyrinogen-3 oxidase
MGYTDQHTDLVIALGAGSINDSWDAFAQNEKTLKNYLPRVRQEDYPPLIKSHYHSAKDKQLRKKILNLICHFEADWLNERGVF